MSLSLKPTLALMVCFHVVGITAGGFHIPFYRMTHGERSHYHCERRGQECKNGGDCYDDDGCYCPQRNNQQYTGVDCGINVTGFPNDDRLWNDDCPCENIDYCFRGEDGVTPFCVCPPDYFGEFCSSNRVVVNCDADSMKVLYKPFEPFYGIVYFGGNKHDPECRLYDYQEGEYTYSNVFSDNVCNLTVESNSGSIQSNVSYTRQMTVQYDPLIESGLDLVLDVTCYHLENGTWTTGGQFGVERGNPEKGDEIQSAFFPVEMKLTYDYRATDRLNDTVYIGERIHMSFYLVNENKYTNLFVESCTFSNSDESKTMLAIENSCPTQGATGIILSNPERVYPLTPRGIRFQFRAFRFTDDPVLEVSCRIRLCQDLDTSCDMPRCYDNDRRKRDTSNEEVKMRRSREAAGEKGTVYRTLNVVDPYVDNGQASKVLDDDDCLKQPVVQSVGISLIVAVVILTIVCLALALWVCRLKSGKNVPNSLSNSIQGGFGNGGFVVGSACDLKAKGYSQQIVEGNSLY